MHSHVPTYSRYSWKLILFLKFDFNKVDEEFLILRKQCGVNFISCSCELWRQIDLKSVKLIPKFQCYVLLTSLSICSSLVGTDCPVLGIPINGRKYGSKYKYRDEVTFECDDGYVLKGSAKREFTKNDNWSGKETLCKGWQNYLTLRLFDHHQFIKETVFFYIVVVLRPSKSWPIITKRVEKMWLTTLKYRITISLCDKELIFLTFHPPRILCFF